MEQDQLPKQQQNQTPQAPILQSQQANTPEKPKTILIVLSFVLILGSGVIALIVRALVTLILGNPKPDTSGMAIVNISTFATMTLCLVVGMIMGIMWILKNYKYGRSLR